MMEEIKGNGAVLEEVKIGDKSILVPIIKHYRYGIKFAHLPCPTCGKDWYTRVVDGRLESSQCRNCANKRTGQTHRANLSAGWKGGRRKYRGYISQFISLDSPYLPMSYQLFKNRNTNETTGAYVLEHRLIMAQSLGRLLTNTEIVHHKNGIKNDNRLENLHLTDRAKHATDYGSAFAEGYTIGYQDALKGVQHHNL